MADYFSNKELMPIFLDWQTAVFQARKEEKPEPVMPEILGKAILQLAHKITSRGNFANYSYRDLMEADIIEVIVKYSLKFNREKGNNLFAYWSTFAYHAAVNRIKIEKRQQNIKIDLLKEIDIEDLIENESDGDISQFVEYIKNQALFNNDIDNTIKSKVKKPKRIEYDEYVEPVGLLAFISEEEEEIV
jgi:hypothetical protein